MSTMPMPLSNFFSRLRAMGPYLVLELILPGGTLIALLLWLSQRFGSTGFGSMHAYVSARLLGRPAIEAPPHDHADNVCMQWEEQLEALCLACR